MRFSIISVIVFAMFSIINAQVDTADSSVVLNLRMSSAQSISDSIESHVQSTSFHTAADRKAAYVGMYQAKACASRAAGTYYSYCARHTDGTDKNDFSRLAWISRHEADKFMNLSYSNLPSEEKPVLGSGRLNLN